MSKADDDHIAAVGKATFDRAKNAALVAACADSRLTGATKLRMELAQEAAMRATGATHKRTAVPSPRVGELYSDMVPVIDEVMASCIERAKATLPTPAEATP